MADEIKIENIAKMLKISNKLKNKATELSGGEMQRVAIGRALVRKPNIYLMDEPLSSLDAKLRESLRIELKNIQTNLNATILYVTHDQAEATTLADKIGVLKEGKIVQIGTPEEIYENPNSIYVSQRLGSPKINVLPGSLFDINENKIIIGAVNINFRFGLNSIWQYASSFYNNFLFGKIGITIPHALVSSLFFILYIDNARLRAAVPLFTATQLFELVYFENFSSLKDEIKKIIKPNDTVVFMGAGSISSWCNKFVQEFILLDQNNE